MEKKQITHSDIPSLLIPHYTEGTVTFVSISPETSPVWPTLSNFFKKQKVSMPLMFSKPEYQLETLFYYVCREHKVPSVAGSVYTLPVTLEVIATLKPDLLVAQSELAGILLSTLLKKDHPISFKGIFLFADIDKTHVEKVHTLAPDVVVVTAKHPLET